MVRLVSHALILASVVCVCSLWLVGCRSVDSKVSVKPDLTYEPPLPGNDRRAALPGRYLGFLRLSKSPYKIPMIVDLIAVKSRNAITRYEGFARFSLGGFQGNEFRVEYYPHFVLNHETKEFSSSEESNQLVLVDSKLKAHSIITGKVKEAGQEIGDYLVIYTGKRKKLDASQMLSKVFPNRISHPEIGGEYYGVCRDRKSKLSLTVGRWDYGRTENPGFLVQYRMWGVLGHEDSLFCGQNEFCVKAIFDQASLDIASNKLYLASEKAKMTCSIGNQLLTCDTGCSFEKNQPSEMTSPTLHQIVERFEREDKVVTRKEETLNSRIDFEGAVTGEYFGYLFNETSRKYQLYRLKVTASMVQDAGMPKESAVIAGVGTMFYGEADHNEFSVNQFKGEFYSESGPKFIFKGDGDQIIQVSRWGRHGIRAVLYSKAFGRVGTLELSREGVPKIPDGQNMVKMITGFYAGSDHSFELIAQPNISESMRQFFPLSVRGHLQKLGSGNKRTKISDLKYDVYSGMVSMVLFR